MSDREFSGSCFTFEPVKGARSFDIDNLGRLTGVTHRQVWVPGENVSECRKQESYGYGAMIKSGSIYAYGGDPYGVRLGRMLGVPLTGYWVDELAAGEKSKQKSKHEMKSCACGFYGYYDGSNDYGNPARVSGVVEGFGEVLIGTRGFRAAKARIVALSIGVDKDGDTAVSYALNRKVRRNYNGVPFYDTFEEMVQAYPTDVVYGPTPETDPEFWTRAATS